MDWGSSKLARRGAIVSAVAFVCAVSPALAADDPLLSGYSGPGGGEQVVIGSSVVPPKNGNGSIRQGGGATAQAPAQPSSGGSSSGGGAGETPAGKPADKTAQQTPVTPAAVAAKPIYPNKVSSASGLPLSRSDMILIVGALLAAGLVAIAAVRLRGSGA